MRYFAVVQGPGPRWDPARSREAQEGWSEHARFMNRLAEEGFVVLGGPLDETRAMLIIDAPNPDEIKRRLSPDPWHEAQILLTTSIQPWQILLDRSAEVQPR